MEKEEIARYEQFLLYHSVFKRLILQTSKNQGLFGRGLTNKDLYCRHLKTRACLEEVLRTKFVTKKEMNKCMTEI